MVLIPELAALTLALSVYTSAFIAEIIRAGIQAVPHGQHEAARSLGLPNTVTLRRHHSSGATCHYSAADQSIFEYCEKLIAGRRHWLSRHGITVRWHGAKPDRTGH